MYILGFAGVHLLKSDCPTRTEGDGMENVGENYSFETKKQIQNDAVKKQEFLRDRFIYNPEELKNGLSKPPTMTGRIIQLRPAPIVVKAPKTDQKFQMLHGKEPKFVPYEPYKGAVNPMVPHEKIIRRRKTKNTSVTSLAEPTLEETKVKTLSLEDLSIKTNQAVLQNNEKLQKELERLQKENQQLEHQLKFQVQVKCHYFQNS